METSGSTNFSEEFDPQFTKSLRNKKPRRLPGFLYRRRDLNPYGHFCPLDFKSSVSTNSTTSAAVIKKAERVRLCGAKNGIRTRDLHLGKVALYQLSYFRVLHVNIPSYKGGSKFKIIRINTKGIFIKNKGQSPIFLPSCLRPRSKAS